MAIRRVILAKPRGFCAGVVRAIGIVERALALFPPPIYVFHEIVHNRHIVERLRQRGVVFVDRIADVPEGATCIFSAHGVSPQVRAEAAARKLRVIDATCPLVTKVHLEAVRFAREGYTIVLIGHPGHEEVEGTMGEAPMHLVSSVADVEQLPMESPERIVYLTQTTLSVDDTAHIVEALRRRFPHLEAPPKDDICYATQNRQNAVKALAREADLILVIGSQNSSNSQRLREVAQAAGVPAYVINDETEIQQEWLDGATTVGVTAGASAPEELVERVVAYLRALGAESVEEMPAEDENVYFALPMEIVRPADLLGKNP
ncbi:MAG: 4-hydroxy-3-methylbut-2-enyl diphosphate reductase [Blastocatellia bacterium]|nr:4-hydroxy-3-methylbut-2-enyl diphosphate reductase [Blastocatellia bacterium]MCS7157074.1 4-hydroxy-3-methylbut-2-enyl diphosphate reductase [Blastocatellia bacterium]MCX7752275.1 4-hydroxy-3-methylbut-2-enyl diphosphate reductase [Blastocatellia bacterium]MDW8167767.1 4-hydroxy-3-methylbut-2-enyl diphosphate reductase [Acidobacteriota bacterium]MDW8256588.1 4-hydroxy-3-methylbut-2-enyl diphosphate reductase [Acidobacteriota bacterium]